MPKTRAALRPNYSTPWPPNPHPDRAYSLFMTSRTNFATKPSQSLARQVVTGLPERRYALGATHHCVDRSAGAPGTHPGAVRALEPQCLLSLRLAAGLSPPWPGQLGLP